MPSRSPMIGSPGLSRPNQAITSITSTPANTTMATASIHHQSRAMLWACGLCVETIDCGLPQPLTTSPQRTVATAEITNLGRGR